jgi:hypothetical protein
MNWVLNLGYRDIEYRGGDFFVRIEPTHREAEELAGSSPVALTHS